MVPRQSLDPEVDALNSGASFDPWVPAGDNGGVEAFPCLTVAGVQVYGYVRRDEYGRPTLVVSCDFDTADESLVDPVAVQVTMGGHEVWHSAPGEESADSAEPV